MKTLTCLACGHVGTDVYPALVEYRDPRPVEVAIPVAHDKRGHVIGNEVRVVPGRYGAEWRCADRTACEGRVRALETVVSDEEAVGWAAL